jgi:hypothetical protein
VPDFIDTFMEWTENEPSPYIFRLWSSITCVAGALERRIWTKVINRPTFANLFVLLTANPGIGKGVIDDVARLWKKSGKLHVAPDSVTAASLLDALVEAKRIVANGHSIEFEYHSLVVPAEEFGVLVPAHDLEFLNRLNKIFTNPDDLRVRRKYIKDEIVILQPQMTILGGTQPAYLSDLFPEVAWGGGFTQRLLFIHSGITPMVKLFLQEPARDDLERTLVATMKSLVDRKGQLRWDTKAATKLSNWHASGGVPRPTHPRLVHYLNRRTQFLIKLMMISSASRGADDVIMDFDYDRGLSWLLAAEQVMPDIFMAMVQKSDNQILQNLMYWLWEAYLKAKKPIHVSRLHAFLGERVPSEKVPHLMALAIRANLIINDPTGSDTFKPAARDAKDIL